jgi:hypothetical protein
VLKGYALHHITTAEGVITIRNDFTAGLGTFQGRQFSGAYTVRDIEGDCTSAPATRFRADYVGYFNDNSRRLRSAKRLSVSAVPEEEVGHSAGAGDGVEMEAVE